MAETLIANKRETRGTRHARRLRADGSIPAILYGHGQQSVSLTVNAAILTAAVRHGSRLVELSGDVAENALIREIQWDTFGAEILHVDFTRVSDDERIEVSVTIELRGEAPGIKVGGVVEHQIHALEVECPAVAIPEKMQVNINSLELGDSIFAKSIELPPNVSLLSAPDLVIVQCVEPTPEREDEGMGTAGIEPEVIGRKADEEDGGE
ncbi:MAG: 50S ribosomal protein L25 [Planctomycetales bacterium]